MFLVVSFSITAQISQQQCDSQSTLVNTSCGGSYCASVQVELTGDLETDVNNFNNTGGTMRRKPNVMELIAVVNYLEDETC